MLAGLVAARTAPGLYVHHSHCLDRDSLNEDSAALHDLAAAVRSSEALGALRPLISPPTR